MKNKFDFGAKQIKIVTRMAVNPFWGVETSRQRGKVHRPQKDAILDLVGVMIAYTIGFLKLKAIMTVVGGFSNTPIAKASIKYLFFFLTLAVKTVSLLAVVVTVSDFSFNCLFKEGKVMATNKKPNQILLPKSLIKTTTAILTTALILSACHEDKPDKTTARGRGKYEAGTIKHEVHLRFLSCYPLDPRKKRKCIDKIADEYLKERYDREYNAYLQSFQSESEKLGFKYFLEEHSLSCKSVPHSPQLINSKENIYFISCSSGEKYFMQFDYDNKQWSIKDQGGGNNG